MQLTAQQIRRFHNAGFLAVTEPVLDATEIARLRGLYDRMFAERAGREEGRSLLRALDMRHSAQLREGFSSCLDHRC